jgi:hypothetical protein
MEKFIFGLIVAAFIVAILLGRKANKTKKELDYQLFLFPNYFRSIGLIIAIVSVVFVAYLDFHGEELWKTIAIHSINLGLFFYCFAKDKQEDELTGTVRLRSFYNSVLAGIVFVVLIHFMEFLLGNEQYVYPAKQFITLLLFVYAISFAILKRKVFYGK